MTDPTLTASPDAVSIDRALNAAHFVAWGWLRGETVTADVIAVALDLATTLNKPPRLTRNAAAGYLLDDLIQAIQSAPSHAPIKPLVNTLAYALLALS